MSRSRQDSRLLPAERTAVAVVAFIAVTAATSHTSVWSTPRDGVGYVSELLAVVASSFAVTLAVAVVLHTWLGRTREATWRSALPAVVVVAVLVSLFGISQTDLHLEAPVAGAQRVDGSGGRLGIRLRSDWRGSAVRNGDSATPDAEGALPASSGRALLARVVLVVAGALALALAVRMRGSGRRSRRAAESSGGNGRIRVAAHRAIVRSIDAMLADPDDRTAIIGAYARLLEELDAIGASRRPYEGPTEHLHRVLNTLQVGPGPLRALVRLFEVARFSEHSLTRAHRHRALAALREAAAALSVPAGSQPGTGGVE